MNTSTSPSVQYAYSTLDASNRSRLTSVTYPSGYVLTYNYSSGINSDVSRLSSLTDASGTVESYDYLGVGTVVVRGRPQSGVDLSMLLKSPESFGDAGDQYNGLDRFGRVVDQRWRTSSADMERTLYGYDRNSNRVSRTNSVNSAYDEAYTYDGFNQLTGFNRNSGARTQAWDYDAVGNWESLTTNGGSPQTRTHNKQNEITAVSGATSPTFDANGNMTTDETGKQYVYDAWNRLKVVKDSGGTTLKTYVYDALNRRVAETASGTTTDFYYSAQWQVLEEAVAGTTAQRYVWSPVYVDALILRDRDTDANGSLDERLWVMQDANWNVVGLVNDSGTVVERYAYDPFGSVIVMNGSWTVIGGSAYGWVYLLQGRPLDATSGQHHVRMREYSPTVGRWTSMDPAVYHGKDSNLYRSISNNHISRIDPTGLIGLFFDGTGRSLGDATIIGQMYGVYNGSSVYYKVDFIPNNIWSNIRHAENAIRSARRHNDKEPIDLFGWSRGAIAAMTVAAILEKDCIEVRYLGLIEPVSTGGFQMTGTTIDRIPGNVKHTFMGLKKPNNDLGDNTIFRNPLELKLWLLKNMIGMISAKTLVINDYDFTHSNSGYTFSSTLVTDMWNDARAQGLPVGTTEPIWL